MKKMGACLSEKQWGTVREHYSQDGNAWNYFSHDQSRSPAYRSGEDGLGGNLQRQAAAVFCPWRFGMTATQDRIGTSHENIWDEQDGFYDVLRFPDGGAIRLKVRSMAGLLPLCASAIFEANTPARYPKLMELIWNSDK